MKHRVIALNYFVVDTAFQQLCAIEAREALALGELNRLVIEARGGAEGRELNLKQILALDDGGWESVDVLVFPRSKGPRRSIFRLLKLLKIRFKYGRGDKLFAGTLSSSWVRRIAGLLGVRKVVRLDDGSASIPFVRKFRLKSDDAPRNDYLFTVFHRDDDEADIIRNDFNTLKRSAVSGSTIDDALVWLVGGAYAEARFLTLERELEIFRKLVAKSRSARIIYFPHRADRASKLDLIAAMGVNIAPEGNTFERRLLDEKQLPSRICGIASTALIMARILKPNITVCAVSLDPAPNKAYSDIMDEARFMGVEILDELSGSQSTF